MDRLRDLALKELALEGPGGIPLQDFWQVFFAASKLHVGGAGDHPAVRAKVWKELKRDSSGTCIVFRPPESTSANDREKVRNMTKDVPKEWSEGAVKEGALQRLSLDEAEKTGVWLLASQEAQDAALSISEIASGRLRMPAQQRTVLAMAGKARHSGALQVEIADAMGITHKNFHYIIKNLVARSLITRQSVLIEAMKLTSALIFHSRFHIQIPVNHRLSVPHPYGGKSHIVTAVSDEAWLLATCDILEAQDGKTMAESLLKRKLGAVGKSGHRLWRRVRLKLETTKCASIVMQHVDEKDVPCAVLHKHWREMGEEDEEADDKVPEGEEADAMIPEVFRMRRFLEKLIAKGEEGITTNEVSVCLGMKVKRTLGFLDDIRTSWGLIKVAETDKNKKTLCYRFKAPDWLLKQADTVPTHSIEAPSGGWLAAVAAATDSGKLEEELQSMEGVAESLVEVPKDWMLSTKEVVAAIQMKESGSSSAAAAHADDAQKAAAVDSGSLDAVIAKAAEIDRMLESVKKDLNETGYRAITSNRVARLLGLVLRNPPFYLARRASRVLQDFEGGSDGRSETHHLDRKSFKTLMNELSSRGLIKIETLTLAPPRCKPEEVDILMPPGHEVTEEMKTQMCNDVLAFRLEIKAYQTSRLIVQNVQAMRAGARWVVDSVQANEGALLPSAQAMRKAFKSCHKDDFDFDGVTVMPNEAPVEEEKEEEQVYAEPKRRTRSRAKRPQKEELGALGEGLAPVEDYMEKKRGVRRKVAKSSLPEDKQKRRLEHLCHILPMNGYLVNKASRVRLLHYFLCHLFGVSSSGPGSRERSPTGTSALKPINKPEELLAGVGDCGVLKEDGKINKDDLGHIFTGNQLYKSFPLDLYMQLVGGTCRPSDFEELRLRGATVGDLTAVQFAGLQDSVRYHTMAMNRLGRDLQALVDLRLLVLADCEIQDSAVDHALHAPIHRAERLSINLRPKLEEPRSEPSSTAAEGVKGSPESRRWRMFDLRTASEMDAYWALLEHRCLFMVNDAKKLSPLEHPQLATLSNPRTVAWHSLTVMSLQQWDALMDRLQDSSERGAIDWVNCRRIAHDLRLSYQQVLALSYRFKQRLVRFGMHKEGMAAAAAQRYEARGIRQRGKRKMTDEEIEAGRQSSAAMRVSAEEARAARLQRTAKRRATGRVNALNLTEEEAARHQRHAAIQAEHHEGSEEPPPSDSIRGDRFVWNKEMDNALLRTYIRYKVKNPLKADTINLTGLPCGDNGEAASRRIRFLKKINQTSSLMVELVMVAEKVGERKARAAWTPIVAIPTPRTYPSMVTEQEQGGTEGQPAEVSAERPLLEPWASLHAADIDMPHGNTRSNTLIPVEAQLWATRVANVSVSSTRRHYFKEPRPMPHAIANRCRSMVSGTSVISENEQTFFPFMNAVGPAMCNATTNTRRAGRVSAVTYQEVALGGLTEGAPGSRTWREISAMPLFDPMEGPEDFEDNKRLEQLVTSIVDVATYWFPNAPSKPFRAHTQAQAAHKGVKIAPSVPTRLSRSYPTPTRVNELFDDSPMLSKFLNVAIKEEPDDASGEEKEGTAAGWRHLEVSSRSAAHAVLGSLIDTQARGLPLPEAPPTEIAIATEALKGLFHHNQDKNGFPQEVLRDLQERFTRLELRVAFAYLRRQGALCKANSPFPFHVSRYFQQRLLCQDISFPASMFDEAAEALAAAEGVPGAEKAVMHGEALTGETKSQEGDALTGGAVALLLHQLASGQVDLQPRNFRISASEAQRSSEENSAGANAIVDLVVVRSGAEETVGTDDPEQPHECAVATLQPVHASVAQLTDGASELASAVTAAAATEWRLEDIAKDPAVRVEAEVAFVAHCEDSEMVQHPKRSRIPTLLLALLRDSGPSGLPLADVPARLRAIVLREATAAKAGSGGTRGRREKEEGEEQEDDDGSSGIDDGVIVAIMAAAIRHGLAAVMMGWQEARVLAGEEAARLCVLPAPGSGESPRCLRVWLNPQGTVDGELAAALEQRALSVVLRCPGVPEEKVVRSLDMVCPMAARLVLAELVAAGAMRVRTQPKVAAGPPALLLRGKRKAPADGREAPPQVERFYFPVVSSTFAKRGGADRFKQPGSQGPIP